MLMMPSEPNFSIVLETVNLQHEPAELFHRMMQSLQRQTLSPSRAHEVLLLDTRELQDSELQAIEAKFDWLSVIPCEPGLSYDEVKLKGLRETSADIVVFADSDCIYEPQWLESLVSTFENTDVQVVAGETSTEITGPYTLALSMTCCFPRYSGEHAIGRAEHYEYNNVAFRRGIISRVAIPENLPTGRGAGFLHAVALQRAGVPIFRHPAARALHPVAGGMAHFLEHFTDRGLESACASIVLDDVSGRSYRPQSRLSKFLDRGRQSLREDPSRYWLLPLALPIAALSTVIYAVGRLRGRLLLPRVSSTAR